MSSVRSASVLVKDFEHSDVGAGKTVAGLLQFGASRGGPARQGPHYRRLALSDAGPRGLDRRERRDRSQFYFRDATELLIVSSQRGSACAG